MLVNDRDTGETGAVDRTINYALLVELLDLKE
jgi:hypothetical protein